MAFTRFSFSKVWTDHEDFPTIENNETQVRADMQFQPDELKDAINGLATELESTTAAANIGFASTTQVPKTTVQEAIKYLGTNTAGAVANSHTHSNKGIIDQITNKMISLLSAFSLGDVTSVVTDLSGHGGDNSSIPTSGAVLAAITETEFGDNVMLQGSYDTSGAGGAPTGYKVDLAVNAEKLGGELPSAYQTALTFDDEPTEDSNNVVTSGAIYAFVNSAIDESILSALGGDY